MPAFYIFVDIPPLSVINHKVFFTFMGKGENRFLPLMQEEPFFHFFPMDILEKGFNIISSFKAVIDHKGMLKDIHDQNRHSS
jgi:hypothetical protein